MMFSSHGFTFISEKTLVYHQNNAVTPTKPLMFDG